MTQANYQKIMGWIKAHEGGFVDHPQDPGGRTNFGITQATYDASRQANGLGQRNVKMIDQAEVAEIYERQYWSRVQGDALPDGVDYTVMDYAVNSGASRSVKVLQRLLGVKVDGVVGMFTLAAARKKDPVRLINDICDERMAFLRKLRIWPTFKGGWTKRVSHVRINSVALAQNSPTGDPDGLSPGKATETLVSLLRAFLAFLRAIFK